MREVGVHYYHEVAGAELQTVNVGCTEAEFACAGFEEDVWRVGFCELVCDDLSSVRGAVVDDYELPVELPGGPGVSICTRMNCEAGSNVEEYECSKGTSTYCSVKVRFSSQVMMGRLRRSL